MTHVLDTYPLDFSQPAVQELQRKLTQTFDDPDAIKALLKLSGIVTTSIRWSQSPDLLWMDSLTVAAKQDRIRVLLSVAAQDPNAAVIRPVLAGLLAQTPARPATETGPSSLNWRIQGNDPAGLERQIESESTLLDIAFLQRGLELSASVAKLLVTLNDGRKYHGTGFRIGQDLLLTNHHVLFDDAGPGTSVEAWFGYELSFTGAQRAHTVIPGDPASIVGRADHDWAVVRTTLAMPASAEVVQLAGTPVPEPLDRVYIIQHPLGQVKKIGMVHNVVTAVTEDVVQYRTDTEAGSSGSPVFNERWEVVALHHRWGSTVTGGRREFYNQGRRIDRVLAGLHAEGLVSS